MVIGDLVVEGQRGVLLFALGGVAHTVIGLLDFEIVLGPFFGLCFGQLAGLVGMLLQGKFLVGFLDFVGGRHEFATFETQNVLVVVLEDLQFLLSRLHGFSV